MAVFRLQGMVNTLLPKTLQPSVVERVTCLPVDIILILGNYHQVASLSDVVTYDELLLVWNPSIMRVMRKAFSKTDLITATWL